MSKIILTIFSIVLCLKSFCQTKSTTINADKKLSNTSYRQKDTLYWVDNLRQFRDALYQQDKSKAKEFVDFPLKNEENNIWHLIYSENEKAINKLTDTIKPLTEKDFEKYFEKVFSKQFINAFLKIKTEDLYRNGNSESPEFKDSSTTYKILATYDRVSNTIDLNLMINTLYMISNTEYDIDETSFIYRFSILENGHIKFKRLIIAG